MFNSLRGGSSCLNDGSFPLFFKAKGESYNGSRPGSFILKSVFLVSSTGHVRDVCVCVCVTHASQGHCEVNPACETFSAVPATVTGTVRHSYQV